MIEHVKSRSAQNPHKKIRETQDTNVSNQTDPQQSPICSMLRSLRGLNITQSPLNNLIQFMKISIIVQGKFDKKKTHRISCGFYLVLIQSKNLLAKKKKGKEVTREISPTRHKLNSFVDLNRKEAFFPYLNLK